MQDARSKYLKKINTPTPFSEGPEMKNYSRMMDLQSQAPNFTGKDDPRFAELKDRRRTYNRFDKYKIGDKFNVAPLDVQKDFSNRTNNFRNAAPNVYGKMYPIQNLAMKYGESGGLMGMIAKEMFGKISNFGKDMANRVGITGAANSDEAEMADYAAQTFGFGAPTFPGSEMTIPYPHQDYLDETVTIEDTFTEPPLRSISSDGYDGPIDGSNPRGEVTSANPAPGKMGLDPNIDYGNEMNMLDAIAEDNVRFNRDVKAFPSPIKEPPVMEGMAPPEEITPTPIKPKFDDSGREAGIASMYGQGPQFAKNNRRYEKEYRDFTESMSDTLKQFGPVPYEEFVEMYEKMFQGKPQVGFSRTLVNR
jgi:hypothetical protein